MGLVTPVSQIMDSGNNLPDTLPANMLFYKIGTGVFFYDEGKDLWLSEALYSLNLDMQTALQPQDGASILRANVPDDYNNEITRIYIETARLTAFPTSDPATNYVTAQLSWYQTNTPNNLGAPISTNSFNINQWNRSDLTIDTSVNINSARIIQADVTETGAFTGSYACSLNYRLVG